MQDLMKGKRGLVMGIANDHSIAWGIARTLAAQGAGLAFTYQGDALGKRVKPLAQSLGVDTVLPCDVENLSSVDELFASLRKKWGQLDFLVHAIAFSDKSELKRDTALTPPRSRWRAGRRDGKSRRRDSGRTAAATGSS